MSSRSQTATTPSMPPACLACILRKADSLACGKPAAKRGQSGVCSWVCSHPSCIPHSVCRQVQMPRVLSKAHQVSMNSWIKPCQLSRFSPPGR